MRDACLSALVLSLLPGVFGLTFSITSSPAQCSDLSVSWSDDGVPPYELTLVPTSSSNASVVDVNTTSTSWTGVLPFPDSSSFVAVLSDATGFGSGGTSSLLTVGNSSDTSCLPTSPPGLNFTFFITPANLSQCSTALFVFAGVMTPPVSLSAVVVGGHSHQLSESSLLEWNGSTLASMDGQVVGFGSLNWTVDMPAESSVVFLAGDEWGLASGAYSSLAAVGNATDSSCLAGSPFTASAGPSATSQPTSTSKSETPSIIGGVVGGVAGVLLVALLVIFLLRRRNIHARRLSMQERSIGLRQYPLDGFNRGAAGLTDDAFTDE